MNEKWDRILKECVAEIKQEKSNINNNILVFYICY